MEPSARELLASYAWPGNVRELQNIVTRACVLNQGRAITVDELRPWLRSDALAQTIASVNEPKKNLPVGMTLDEVERRMILATLEQFDGHRAKTAEALGIGLRTLSGKLRDYGYAPREKNFANAQ
jgi:DNA-binding NtrC family response regulator